MNPPNTTLAISRCTLTGHHVGFQVAAQARAISDPSEITTGLAWKVAHEFGTIMIKNAKMLSRNPRKRWTPFIPPDCIASQPYQYKYSVTVSNRNSAQYTTKDGKKISVRYPINFGYRPIKRNSRMPPNKAVVA